MDKEKLKRWLAAEGRDREWLASQIGSVKGTVDQWFSRGFPDWACKSIERLMQPIEGGNDTTGFEVTFTAREFERIEEARKLLGIATRKLYYEEAIAGFTDQVLASEATSKTGAAQNITYLSGQQPSSLVAEDPPKPRRKNGTED